jgi:MFS family permease
LPLLLPPPLPPHCCRCCLCYRCSAPLAVHRDTAAEHRVKAAFALGYLLAQLAGGWAAARWGSKRCQMLAMLVCIVGLCTTPALIAAAPAPAPSAFAMEALCCAMGLCYGVQHPTTAALMDRWCLPSERRWVGTVDGLASVAGCLLNCLVIAKLMAVLDWRATMLLLAGVTAVALIGVKFFVTDGPAASTGRLRLSDGEAALFRAESMLIDEPPPPSAQSAQKSSSSSRMSGLVASSVTWALIGVEMMVAWR